MVISKKTIIFQGFRGGPTFSKVGPTFSGGGGGGGGEGGKTPIKPVIFQGGGLDPLSPLWSALEIYVTISAHVPKRVLQFASEIFPYNGVAFL